MQTGEPTLDSHVTDRLYSFTWNTKEACKIEPKDDESGCNDKDTRIYLLKTPDKKVILIEVILNRRIKTQKVDLAKKA